jgi:DNA-binding protein H-NS
MATYNPLLLKRQKLAEEQAELEQQVALERAQASAAALAHIRQLIAKFGVLASEIAPPAPRKSSKASAKARKAGKAGKNAKPARKARSISRQTRG